MNSTLNQVFDQRTCPECGSTDLEYSNEITCRSCGLVIDEELVFLHLPDRNQACQPVQFKQDTIHTIGNDKERRNSRYEWLAQLDTQTIQTTVMNNERTAMNRFKYLIDFYGNKRLFDLQDLMEIFNYAYNQLPIKSHCRNPDALALAVYTKAYEYFKIYLTPVDPATQKLHFDVVFSTFTRICLAVRTKIFQFLDKKLGERKSEYIAIKNQYQLDEPRITEFKRELAHFIQLDSSFYQFITSVLIKNKHRIEFGKKPVQRYAVVTGIVLYKLGLLPKQVRMNYLAKSAHLNQDNLKRLIYNLAESSFTKQFDAWKTHNLETVALWIQSFAKVKQYEPLKANRENINMNPNSSADLIPETIISAPITPEITFLTLCIPELVTETVFTPVLASTSINYSTEILDTDMKIYIGHNIGVQFIISRFIDIDAWNLPHAYPDPSLGSFHAHHPPNVNPIPFRDDDGPPPWA